MALGALIDLGVPVKWLRDSLLALRLTGLNISVSKVRRNGITAKDVYIHTEEDCTVSRNYNEICSLINASDLSQNVKAVSLDIFETLAVAESGIHGVVKEKVHFHEIGGIDAIADIVGTALCIEYLGIEKIISSKIPIGSGFVKCSHGTLPVPAPATVEILKNVPVYGSDIRGEMVTPTGAAIITNLTDSFENIPEMIIDKVGYGAGKKNFGSVPNVLRIITGRLCEDKISGHMERIAVIETNIDDMNPEIFGFLMDRLFEDGALDVYWIPVFMKKNRPGTMIQVLCPEYCRDKVIRRILSESTSIGLRYYYVKRVELKRESIEINTPYGMARVKQVINPDQSVRIVPEYEVCKKIAVENNIPVREVYERILYAIGRVWNGKPDIRPCKSHVRIPYRYLK